MFDLDAFRADSDQKIAEIIDSITRAISTCDKLRMVDVLSHLKKVQASALASGDESDAAIFLREFTSCYRAAACAEEWRDGSDDVPTPAMVDEFKNIVLCWCGLDEEEKMLKKKILDARRVKAQLDATIFAFMNRFDLDDAVCELGTLRLVRGTSKRALSKGAMLERLSEFFADDTVSADALRLNLFSAAATVPTARLKRIVPRLTGSPATAARLALTSA
jgi:hypothetical protein